MSSNIVATLSSRTLLDVLIQAGLIAVLAVFCYGVLHPFRDLMLWSMILAVTLYPLHIRLRSRLGSDGRAATLIVVIGIATMLLPMYFLGMSLADSAGRAVSLIRNDEYHIPPPPESLASWPLVGQGLYDTWLQASTDLTALVRKLAPQLKGVSISLLGTIAGVGIGFLVFVAALIIAGIYMAFGESGRDSPRPRFYPSAPERDRL